MTIPMYRRVLFVAVLAFGVAGATVAKTEETTAEQAKIAAPPTAGSPSTDKGREGKQRTASLRQKTGPYPSKASRSPSNFVRLSHLLLGNAYPVADDSEPTVGALDSAQVARLLAATETKWAFDRIEPSRYLPAPYPQDDPAAKTIEIQALDLDFGPFTPLSATIYRPLVRGHLVPDDEDTALFDGFSDHAAEPAMGGTIASRGHRSSRAAGTDSGPLTYRYAVDSATSLKAGVAYLPDLDDTKANSTLLAGPEDEGSANTLSGVNLSLGASYRALTLTGGYARALDKRTFADLALGAKESDPVVWNSEIAYSTELLRRETTLALGYQKSSEALYSYLPEERYKTRASMALSGSTIFSLEYYQDREASLKNGEVDGYGITTRIGFDF